MAVYLNSRRRFIKHISVAGAGLAMEPWKLSADSKAKKLVIMHTNDVHSHIHPFADDHPKYGGQGGVIRRSQLIDSIRKENKHTLLLDSGDMFQGTPFFNFYGGELEMKLMTKMKYDAGTIGNHDFDGGVNGLIKAKEFGKFPLLISNYLFENRLNEITQPYEIFKIGGIKVGIFGIGIELEGLVDPDMYKGTIYTDPVIAANNQAKYLKNYENCDLVICLSHLGLSYKEEKISDMKLAEQTENIDLILGGHTHSFLDQPISHPNKTGELVMISQAGWAGLRLGVIEVTFSKDQIELKSKAQTLN